MVVILHFNCRIMSDFLKDCCNLFILILLLSQPHDHSTNKVIDWLVHFKAEFLRIPLSSSKGRTFLKASLGRTDSELRFKFGDDEVGLSEISSVWFRGGDLIDVEQLSETELKDSDLGTAATSFLRWEWTSMNSWVNGLLMAKRHLGNPFLYETNKLMVLEKARAAGLAMPETRILSTREDIISFFEKCNGSMISKAIYNSFSFKRGKQHYAHPTLKVTEETIGQLPENIGPSLFQQEIVKRLDLRCCVVGTNIFCGAIFSQSNSKTRTDFREYDHSRPNRVVPFAMPGSVSKKLFVLMNSLNLNFGLIDMVLSDDDKYYFLEVNPIGQFDALSVDCGFPIEQTITEYLMK